MKNQSRFLKLTVAAMLFSMNALMLSCNNSTEDPISAEATQTVNNESTQESQQDEVDDLSLNAMGNTDSPDARSSSVFKFIDYRISCAVVTRDTAGFKTKGEGKITIDFGAGCTDIHGNVRKGKIMISWTGGRWYAVNSVHVITFSGYSINDVQFSDSDIRTVTNVGTTEQPLLFDIVATHTLTWPDNTTASRSVHKTREWVRTSTIVDDKFIVSQTSSDIPAAVGTNRHGVAYSVAITTPLEYHRSCAVSNRVFRPVIGVKVITYETSKIVTIDYGDGSCDRSFTISADGKTKTVAAKNDSSAD